MSEQLGSCLHKIVHINGRRKYFIAFLIRITSQGDVCSPWAECASSNAGIRRDTCHPSFSPQFLCSTCFLPPLLQTQLGRDRRLQRGKERSTIECRPVSYPEWAVHVAPDRCWVSLCFLRKVKISRRNPVGSLQLLGHTVWEPQN